MQRLHWQDTSATLLGVWLVISPWTLRYFFPTSVPDGPVTWSFVASGLVVVLLGVAVSFSFRSWEEWLEVGIGVWLIASPWILRFSELQPSLWNAILTGAILLVLSGSVLAEEHGLGHS